MLSRIGAVIVLCLMVIGFSPMVAEVRAEVSRVMVLSFDGSAAGDFKYLADSVRAMISSRLAAKPGVEVVDYTLSAEELGAMQGGETGAGAVAAAETLFTKFKVDTVVSGALYALQTGLKIQVTLNRKGAAHAEEGVFTVLAVNEEHIIPSVEELVDDIAARGLGAQAGGALLADISSDQKEGISGFSTEHPEKAFKKGVYGGSIVAESNMKVESLGVRKSSNLPLTLVSMATGDLDNDGALEIVAASRTGIEMYRFDDTLFTKLAEYKFSNSYKIHAVNIADLDGNGQKEIYISANDGIPAASSIFSWSARAGFTPLLTGIGYYIRPVEIPAEGMILAGQKGSTDFTLGFVAKNIVKLSYSADRTGLVEEKILPLPKNVRLFDFLYAEIDGKAGKELVAVDHNEKLLVYDAQNSLLWVSEKDYGGSRNFIGPPKSSTHKVLGMFKDDDEQKQSQPLVFVPLRLAAADLDQDGRDEILVGGNKRTTPKMFVNFREYDGGAVVCLSWRQTEMVDLWRTNTVTGYLADYMFLPEGEGTGAAKVLYVAQVPDAQLLGFAFSGDSKILKYQMTVSTK